MRSQLPPRSSSQPSVSSPKPMTQLFGQDASYEALCWAAWKGSHVSGLVVKPFDEWLDDIDSIEAGDEPRVPLETA
jgi:hypothetical protein